MIAHIGGVPLEEVLPALMGGAGTWLILRVTSLGARLRTTRHAGDVACHEPDPGSDHRP